MNEKSSSNQISGGKHPNTHCLLADASVFIGFTTVPLGEEKEFIENMKDFFKNYREGYTVNSEKKKGLCDRLFTLPVPRAFY